MRQNLDELLKQCYMEIGIKWADNPGVSLIEGVPAADYLKKHDIFPSSCDFETLNIITTKGHRRIKRG